MDLLNILENEEVDWKHEIPELEARSGLKLDWMYRVKYDYVKSIDELHDLAEYLKDKEYVAIDTETTGLIYTDKTVSVQICAEPGVSYFIPIRMESCSNISPKDFVDVLGPVLSMENKTIVAFNWKFDGLRLNSLISTNNGLYLFGNEVKVIDLQIVYKLQDPDSNVTLKSLTQNKLKHDQIELEHLFNDKRKVSSKKAAIRFQTLPLEFAIPYAAADSDMTLQLYLSNKEFVDAEMQTQIISLEHKVQKVIARMEINGAYVNKTLLAKANTVCQEEINRLDSMIKREAGDKFSVNSAAQLADYLYNTLGLQPLAFTEKGAPAVNKEALGPYKESVPFVNWVLKFKEAKKLQTAFLEKIPTFCDVNSCIHPNFNQLGAASGRFSCTNPNFQQLPKQKDSELDFRSAIRDAIQARPGYILFDMDYSQIEYRIFAQLCGDEHLQQAYIDGADFHQSTAAMVYHVPYERVTSLQRKNAKSVNFGLLYGLSSFGLAQRINTSEAEAQSIMSSYFEDKPKVREWQEERHDFVKKHGYVKTYFGRRRLIREIYSKNRSLFNAGLRKSVNSTVQGTAADILKIGFLRLQKVIDEKWPKVMMTLTIHDEILFEVPLEYNLKECFADLQDAMQVQPKEWNVPIIAEPEVGYFFGTLIDLKDFDYDHPEKYLDVEKAEKGDEYKEEEITTLEFILPEKMPEISFKRFLKLIKDNAGDTEFDIRVGSGKSKRANSKIHLSQDLISSMEDMYITVKVPSALLLELD